MVGEVTRRQVLGYRARAQQLDAEPGGTALADAAVLDIGAQDTGPDGGRWALAIRGVDVATPGRANPPATGRVPDPDLVLLWTIRGAPHFYRRADLPKVAAAVQPFSDADAGKRIFDAAKPLKAAGIGNLAALDAVAAAMRSVVVKPTVKGEVSAQLTALMDPPYLRFCRPCNATHLYEQPFRLAAVRAGLELQPDTSPPVLLRSAAYAPASRVPPQFDLVRALLRLLGPATPKQVAEFLDAPVPDVKARWPPDAVEVSVEGERRWVCDVDPEELAAEPPEAVRLLGPYDLFLQARDRSTLVADPARAKALWPALGRPGAVLAGGEIAGLWRPRKSGSSLRVQIESWTTLRPETRSAIEEQAARLAAYRGVRLAGVDGR